MFPLIGEVVCYDRLQRQLDPTQNVPTDDITHSLKEHKKMYYFHNWCLWGDQGSLSNLSKMAWESRERSLALVLWVEVGLERGFPHTTGGEGLEWFESPTSAKAEGTQMFSSACPEKEKSEVWGFKAVSSHKSKTWNLLPSSLQGESDLDFPLSSNGCTNMLKATVPVASSSHSLLKTQRG